MPGGLVAALLAVGALLALVAIVSRSPRPEGTLGGPSIDARSISVNVLFPVLVVVGIASALMALTMRRRRGLGRREYTMKTALSDLLLVAVFALILRLLMWVFRNRSDDQSSRLTQPTPAASAPGVDGATGTAVAGNWRVQLAVSVMTALALGFIAYRAFRRAGLEAPRRRPAGEDLAEVIDESLDALRTERDTRRAVIAAYARMERSLGAAGMPRRPSEAPAEYLQRVLAGMRVSGPPVMELTGLYERAKFDRRPVDERMREQAIAALVAIREQLWAAVS